MDGSVHLDIRGEGTLLALLPPAPHTGAFFSPLLSHLKGFQCLLADYPGYGSSKPVTEPSIGAYAEALASHLPDKIWLMGFHTGNLVAAEIAKRHQVAGIVMIDVPLFTPETRKAYAAKMERNARNTAFHAAFAYDPEGLSDLPCPVRVIATQSSLLEPSRKAAQQLSAPLTERIDIGAPVFEVYGKDMAQDIERAIGDMGRLQG